MNVHKIISTLKSKIGYLKKSEIYCIYFIISLIIIIIFVVSTSFSTNSTNSTASFISFKGFKIYEFGTTVALLVGILAFFASLFNTDKNYKAMKLSSIPDKSANILIDLEFAFNEYKDDEFKLLTEILNYWRDHQKAFRLLTPHFYKEFLKILKTEENKNNLKTSEINAEYIYMAIIAQITNIALENTEPIFSFIKPELIKDDKNIESLGENEGNYTEFEINKNQFNNYISKIKGEKTQALINDKFNNLDKNIKKLLKDLKRELEEYE